MPLVTRLCRYDRVYFLHTIHEQVSSTGLHIWRQQALHMLGQRLCSRVANKASGQAGACWSAKIVMQG
jgi:hypothetical protein